MRPHPLRRPNGSATWWTAGRRCSCRPSGTAWCSPRTSTTCWPVGRSRRRHLRRLLHARGRHRHGRAFEAELDGTSEVGIGIQSGFFHRRRRPADGYRALAREPTPAPHLSPSAPATIARARAGASGRPRGRARGACRGADRPLRRPHPHAAHRGPAPARAGAVPTTPACGSSRWRTGSSAANVGVAGLMVGEDLTRVPRANPSVTATCSPTCACPGVFLDGTRPEDLPGPSRWCRPTASPSGGSCSKV